MLLDEHADLARSDVQAVARLDREVDVRFAVELAADDVVALVSMGPSAHHVTPHDLRRRVGELRTPVGVTCAMRMATYRLH